MSDPYSIKSDLLDNEDRGYKKCSKSCDSCTNFVSEATSITSFASGRNFRIHCNSTCTTKNVIHVAVYQSCGKQGVGSTSWKARVANYKSHIEKKLNSCQIVRHFVEECVNSSFKNLKFVIVDVRNQQ